MLEVAIDGQGALSVLVYFNVTWKIACTLQKRVVLYWDCHVQSRPLLILSPNEVSGDTVIPDLRSGWTAMSGIQTQEHGGVPGTGELPKRRTEAELSAQIMVLYSVLFEPSFFSCPEDSSTSIDNRRWSPPASEPTFAARDNSCLDSFGNPIDDHLPIFLLTIGHTVKWEESWVTSTDALVTVPSLVQKIVF